MSNELNAEHQKYIYELNRRDAERAHDRANDESNKVNEAAITTGNIAVRTAILINGGAAVSLLAFIGGLVGQGKISLGQQLGELAGGLMWFAVGAAAGSVATGAGYFTNYFAAECAGSREYFWEHPYVRPGQRTNMWWWLRAAAQLLAVVAAVVSLVLFIIGMIEVKHSISKLA